MVSSNNGQRERVLVTGASGFIGSHIVEVALEAGYEVWAAVRKTSSKAFLTDKRIKFICLNLGDIDALKGQLAEVEGGWDYVVHAAGATKCLRREDFFRNNLDGTRNLVEALKATGALRRRLVFLSSLSLFGAIRETPDEMGNYREIGDDDEPRPNTTYGESKWAAEQYLATSGIDHVILRPTGVYGPRERDYFIMAKSIKGHIDFSVGYTKQDITFVYVRDLVQAVMRAMKTDGIEGKAFIISDGATYDSRAFSDLLRRELGNPWWLRICAPLWFLRMVCTLNGAFCHWLGKVTTLNMDKYHILAQRNWRCDITPARELLGYKPEWPLERGVKATMDWYKKEGWL